MNLGYVSRRCQENGVWSSTYYLLCIKNIISSVHSVGCRVKNGTKSLNISNPNHKDIECDEIHNDDSGIYKFMILANLIGFCITIVCVSMAIFIFLSIR